MSADEPVSVVDLFPEERDRLIQLLSSLSDAQWVAPTACPGWSVKDIALHLLGDDLGFLSRNRDAFDDPTFASIAAATMGDLVALVNESNELWVRAARRLSPRLLCDLLRITGEDTGAYAATLDPLAPGERVSWAGRGPAPTWLGLAREYTERWVHQQQIRDALGQPGLTERRWLAPVLATFVRALPRALHDVARPLGTRVRVAITGEAGGTWEAARTADGWVLAHDLSDEPAATATLDQHSARRLWTKGLTKDQARRAVALTGDPALANKALDMVAIIA